MISSNSIALGSLQIESASCNLGASSQKKPRETPKGGNKQIHAKRS